jgi:hypothetical protein
MQRPISIRRSDSTLYRHCRRRYVYACVNMINRGSEILQFRFVKRNESYPQRKLRQPGCSSSRYDKRIFMKVRL